MRLFRSLLGVVVGLAVLIGCVAPAAADPPGQRLPFSPLARLLPASQLPDGLASAVTQATRSTSPASPSSSAQTELQASDGMSGDGFGYSVSVNSIGNAAIVGAPGRNGSEGAAYVFVRQAGHWVQQQEVEPSDGAPYDYFGWYVSMNALGNVAIIGAFNHNGEGAAYVFSDRHGTWVQQQELQASDAQVGDGFGISVSLNALGNKAIIGAPNHNLAVGAAYVFVDQDGTWVQQQELEPSDGAPNDGFGYSVALNALGLEAVIGSPEHNNYYGAAYVFVRRGDGWVQQQELHASDGQPGDLFGYSVAVNALGDETIVGAWARNAYQGAAYVFARQDDEWVQQQELQASDGVPDDRFGISVSLNALGDRALIGAYGREAGTGQGAAYLFVGQGARWSQQQELQAFDGAPDDYFGFSVSLNAVGDEALIGALGHDAGQGAAYVIDFP